MKPIYIFRHEDWIQAGRFTEVLDKQGMDYKIIAIDRGDPVPANTGAMSALVFLGGTMSVNDGHDWLAAELRLIRKAADKGLPLLGHCLGSQLISKALGATVQTMPENEIGWHPIRAAANNTSREWFGDLPEQLEVMAWHHDEFSLPEGAVQLFASPYCQCHAFVLDHILATVAHIEVTVAMLNVWLRKYGHDIKPNGASVQSIAQIRHNMAARVAKMHQLTDRLYQKWLQNIAD